MIVVVVRVRRRPLQVLIVEVLVVHAVVPIGRLQVPVERHFHGDGLFVCHCGLELRADPRNTVGVRVGRVALAVERGRAGGHGPGAGVDFVHRARGLGDLGTVAVIDRGHAVLGHAELGHDDLELGVHGERGVVGLAGVHRVGVHIVVVGVAGAAGRQHEAGEDREESLGHRCLLGRVAGCLEEVVAE